VSRDTLGPRDLEAERAVLGACLASEAALSVVLSTLSDADFFSDLHREMFSAIKQASEEHGKADHILAAPYAPEKAGRALADLYESVPLASNASHYCSVVKDAAKARRTLDVVEQIRRKCLSDGYREAPEYALSLMEETAREDADKGAHTYQASLEDFAELVAQRRKNEGVTGVRTGISRMDRGLGGLNRGCSYIIAARPGVGKSLIVGQIAQTAANQGYRVLLQTPEMSAVQYLDRLAHSLADVDYERALEGKITATEERHVESAAKMLASLPVYVDDHGTQTVSRIRANVMRYKPDLLLVDYLQYVTPDDTRASRNQQVGQVSRGLTRIKSDFGIPVVLAAQLNRAVEARHDKRPTLADLRDSGEIEQDADAVMFLHRPGRYADDAPQDLLEIHCEKWRFGNLWEAHVYLKPGHNWLINSRGDVA
jgi:replicative DNA helicase